MECRERTSDEQRAHRAEIEKIVGRWHAGEISITEKRELIARENAFYHGHKQSGRTGALITVPPSREVREAPWWRDA